MKLELGKPLEGAKGMTDCVHLQIDQTGLICICYFAEPSTSEIASFLAGEGFRLRAGRIRDMLIAALKIGSMDWVDAPVTPHLAPRYTAPPAIADGEGLAMTLVLADTVSGVVKGLRFVSLSTDASRAIISTLEDIRRVPFDQARHDADLAAIYTAHTTHQLADLLPIRCDIG